MLDYLCVMAAVQRFLLLLFGTTDVVSLLVGIIFVWLGQAISLRIHATQRNPSSPRTPEDFSWGFLYKDNKKRISTVMMLAFIGLRFSAYFSIIPSNVVNIADNDSVAFTGLILGFSIDKIAELLLMFGKQPTPQP